MMIDGYIYIIYIDGINQSPAPLPIFTTQGHYWEVYPMVGMAFMDPNPKMSRV